MKYFTSTGSFFVIAIFIIISHSASSQTTLRIGAGYMFPLNSGALSPYFNSTTSNPAETPEVHGSWGKGGWFGATVDHQFDKYIDLELGARYRYGASLKCTDTVSALTNMADDHLRLFVFSLGVIYNFEYNKTFIPYIGTGVNVGIDDKIINTETSSDIFGNTTIFNSKLTNEPIFGGYGELGAKCALNSNCFFFFEFRFDVTSLMPKELYYNSVTQDGTDITSTLLPFQQQVDYVKNTTASNFSQLNPTQELAEAIPASSWGIDVGIAFKLERGKSNSVSKKQ